MKTIEQQNANTLFAFQMSLKGHDRFEYFRGDFWLQCATVNNGFPHRIYHDIPAGWVRHDGEDWKGGGDTILVEVMYCNGKVSGTRGVTVEYWKRNFANERHEWRIYAYKLAKKVIPRTKEAAVLAEIDEQLALAEKATPCHADVLLDMANAPDQRLAP